MNRLIIIGAGGHGRVIADIALKIGYTDVAFVDDKTTGASMGMPIVGTTACLDALDDGATDFVIAIGNNSVRRAIATKHRVNWVSLVHPSAQIGVNVKIGVGTVVMAGAIINPCTTVGSHAIINTGAIIEHDNLIGDYAHISPGATLGGTVTVGELTHVGIGATVKNNIKIADGCTLGAGAVAVKNLSESGTYIGVPARMMK